MIRNNLKSTSLILKSKSINLRFLSVKFNVQVLSADVGAVLLGRNHIEAVSYAKRLKQLCEPCAIFDYTKSIVSKSNTIQKYLAKAKVI